MAKWGQGDPRWIVEERPDATNVNNWHWSEKNAGPWSKQRLKELLEGLRVEKENVGSCKITEIKRLEGEATANNRKAKLIFLYEWDVKCGWEGFASGCEEKICGTIKIPNLSDEFSAEEVDVEVTVDSSGPEAESLRELLLTEGARQLREKVARYIRELKDEFSKGLILPTKEGTKVEAKTADSESGSQPKSEVVLNPVFADKHSKNVGVLISTKSLDLKEEFKCRAADLYNTFTTLEMVQAFTNGPCQLEAVKGGRFLLYHGMVEGIFEELVRSERIKMRWRLRSYPEGHFSTVDLKFTEKDDCTELKLEQSQIPECQLEETESGWKRHYFEAIKTTFGFGARLF